MFRITSKVKIAAGLAAGVLTLGAAGAYAANANNTITVDPTKSFSLSNGTTTLNLVPLNNNVKLTLPSTPFTNAGQCVSWFATNRNYALAPTGSSTMVSKNYHGKLISGVHAFCQKYAPSATSTDSAQTDTTTQSAEPTDSTDTQSGASHGNGHANAHSSRANETD